MDLNIIDGKIEFLCVLIYYYFIYILGIKMPLFVNVNIDIK